MDRRFDHEKLHVYQCELQFVTWSTDLIAEVGASPDARSRRISEVIDHLDRAGLSALLNTAEGNGRRQMPVRAKFFDDARGSAMECAACLDAMVAKRACLSDRIERGKSQLVEIVSMLTKLIERFSSPGVVKESADQYGARNGRLGEEDKEEEDEEE